MPTDATANVLTGLGVVLLAFGLYLLPALVAGLRGHRQLVPLFVVNLFLGFTLVGWVVCLAWAFAAAEPARYPRRYRSYEN